MIGKRAVVLSVYKAIADLKVETERYFAGFLWWFFEPILHMGVNYLVFGKLLGHHEADYVAFLLCGMVLWRWLTATVLEGCNSVLTEKWLIQQVHVPKAVFPTVSLLTHTFKFILVFIVLISFLQFNHFKVDLNYLYLPYLLVVFFFMIMAIAYVMASIVPFVPDIRLILDHFFRLAFFLSGIFFSPASISPKFQHYFLFNPFGQMIQAIRNVLLNKPMESLLPIHITFLSSLFVLWIGTLLLKHFDTDYAKISF